MRKRNKVNDVPGLSHQGLRTWIEIDSRVLTHNYTTFRNLLTSQTKLMAVVKSNAYGHDFLQYAALMERLGADWLGVDSITEAVPLREQGSKLPILILGYTLPENIVLAAQNNISVTVSNLEHLKSIKSLGNRESKLKIHLKFDTGMHRQGFAPEDAKKVFLYCFKQLPHVIVEGVYTHFAEAKNPTLLVKTKQQWAEFQKILNHISRRGESSGSGGGLSSAPILRHAAATGGTLTFPESHLDMVRIGIGMMGYWPEAATKAYFENKITLKPALLWKTIVSEVKVLPKGGTVGYDSTESATIGTKLAIIPVGYWHGYVRALSGVGNVLIRGKRAKVIGRVSMDMIAIDVTHIVGVKTWDDVILLGDEITVEEMAGLSGTSSYEVITRINPLIKRIYV